MTQLIHIVLFEFNPALDPTSIQDICNRMLSLKENCIHPETKKPYITTSIGGKDNSPEGYQGGLTHAFISHFENEADRKYYLEKDPAHSAFVKSLEGKVVGARVLDFAPGVF